jgi:hypothetical protein
MFWRSVRSSSIIFAGFIWISVAGGHVTEEEQFFSGLREVGYRLGTYCSSGFQG